MQKNEINDSKSEIFLFFVLMMAITVLIHEFITLNQNFFNQTFNISVLVYPFTFFIINFINKKYGKITASVLIIFTTIFWTCYYLAESFLLTGYSFQKEFLITNIIVFAITQFINLIIYSKLLNNNQLSLINLIVLFIIILSFDTLLKVIIANQLTEFGSIASNYLFNNLISVLISLLTILITSHFSKRFY